MKIYVAAYKSFALDRSSYRYETIYLFTTTKRLARKELLAREPHAEDIHIMIYTLKWHI